jgi:hypothetical protein
MRRLDDDRGSVATFVLVAVVALLALAGLVFDGGALLSTRREGVNVAHGAARVGTQEIDEVASRRAGRPVMNQAAAVREAEAYLARKGWDGDAVAYSDRVEVTVTRTKPLTMLGAIGVGPRTIKATSSARPVFGVSAGEN